MTHQVHKHAAFIPISREVALEYGLVEPTEEERREQEERDARWDEEAHMRRIATTNWLNGLTRLKTINQLARALLDLHAWSQEYGRNTCAECVRSDDDHEDWPCRTVRLITAHYGNPAPEWCEF